MVVFTRSFRPIGAAAVVALLDACGADDGDVEGDPPATSEAALEDDERTGVASSESFSRPFPGLTPEELARFEAGLEEFSGTEGVEDGLGPVFNENSCSACHAVGGVGGGSNVFETRFGRRARGGFDPLAQLGGTLIQRQGIGSEGVPDPACTFGPEEVPAEANVTALRRSTPLFGLGLVDAVPDSTFHELARRQRERTPSIAGRVSIATNRANQQPAVAKFGWKAQIQSLFEFSGNAYLNEMGITSPLFPVENCPNGDPEDCPLLDRCNPVPELNDDGEDVVLFFDFMTLLAPPPRGEITPAVQRGEEIFTRIGCASCHVPTLRTGPSPVAALSEQEFHPYSDFLLHDMASLGDGIGGRQADATGVEAIATGREMRTAPLWGLRLLDRFLHDGRATTLRQAILAHDGQGGGARDRYRRLSREQRRDLAAFLRSL
jgi:CxxC motif-containing protein (DUF1111 family)